MKFTSQASVETANQPYINPNDPNSWFDTCSSRYSFNCLPCVPVQEMDTTWNFSSIQRTFCISTAPTLQTFCFFACSLKSQNHGRLFSRNCRLCLNQTGPRKRVWNSFRFFFEQVWDFFLDFLAGTIRVNEATDHRINPIMIQWINKSMNHWTNEPMSVSLNQLTNQEKNPWTNESMKNQWVDEPTKQWIYEWTNEFVDGWTDDGWMMDDGWTDGWMSC